MRKCRLHSDEMPDRVRDGDSWIETGHDVRAHMMHFVFQAANKRFCLTILSASPSLSRSLTHTRTHAHTLSVSFSVRSALPQLHCLH